MVFKSVLFMQELFERHRVVFTVSTSIASIATAWVGEWMLKLLVIVSFWENWIPSVFCIRNYLLGCAILLSPNFLGWNYKKFNISYLWCIRFWLVIHQYMNTWYLLGVRNISHSDLGLFELCELNCEFTQHLPATSNSFCLFVVFY